MSEKRVYRVYEIHGQHTRLSVGTISAAYGSGITYASQKRVLTDGSHQFVKE